MRLVNTGSFLLALSSGLSVPSLASEFIRSGITAVQSKSMQVGGNLERMRSRFLSSRHL